MDEERQLFQKVSQRSFSASRRCSQQNQNPLPFLLLKCSQMAQQGQKNAVYSPLAVLRSHRDTIDQNKQDKRFVESHDVNVKAGTNLAAMDWKEFEQLVRQVLELEFSKNGGEVRVTQASRDGGVDAVVFDPDPLRGGKIVVQAKRYTNTVGVAAVRDLYGTVINEGASSGILITTSDYGPDSYDFAKDKPLKLLNSGHLLALLHRNGLHGYINLPEAKEIIKRKQDKQ